MSVKLALISGNAPFLAGCSEKAHFIRTLQLSELSKIAHDILIQCYCFVCNFINGKVVDTFVFACVVIQR